MSRLNIYESNYNILIHFNSSLNKWQFDLPNHNVDYGYTLIYNQLFVEDKLYLLNVNTGDLYINTIDLNLVSRLKQYNFHSNKGRFQTQLNNKSTKIHELVYGVKTNINQVINHIDNDPTNNKLENLELVTQWFNTALREKKSGLPIGLKYHNQRSSYVTNISMPRAKGKIISFGSKDINYLQNLHFQFATKSGLVTPERYLQEIPNWLPDNNIYFNVKHQQKLDQLIAAHLANQSNWVELQ